MKCPECQGPMHKGFAKLIDGSFWSKKKKHSAEYKKNSLDYHCLGKPLKANLHPANVCKKCNKVIIDLIN